MADTTNLRLRITEADNKRRIEVLDPDGNVLGDLAASVGAVTWKMGIQGIGIVQIDVACERAAIDSIEVPGYTISLGRQVPDIKGA